MHNHVCKYPVKSCAHFAHFAPIVAMGMVAASLASDAIAYANPPEPAAATVVPAARPTAKPSSTTGDSGVTFLNDAPPKTIQTNDLITVHGLVFQDDNGNGYRDIGERPLAGITIGVQVPGQSDRDIPALTTTDDKGQFTLQAPANAAISVHVPEGLKAIGPTSQFASVALNGEPGADTPDLVFALRPDKIIVQPVVSPPVVNVQVPPAVQQDLRPLIVLGAAAITVLIGLGLVIALLLRRNTRAMTELQDWHAWLMLVRPTLTSPRSETTNSTALTVSPEIPGHCLSQPSSWTLALEQHEQRHDRGDCDGEIDRRWYRLIEQVIADTLRQSVLIDAFLGVSPLPNAWMRFAGRDGRTFTFALSRFNIPGCRWFTARSISQSASHRQTTELRLTYQHFADAINMPAALPRDVTWFVFHEKPVVWLQGGGDIALPEILTRPMARPAHTPALEAARADTGTESRIEWDTNTTSGHVSYDDRHKV